MSYLQGKNTVEALNVNLSDLVAIRRTGSNTLPLPEVDQHLVNRPDYIIWRLLRERQPQHVLALPKGIGGGVELFLTNLKKAADTSDMDIKWTTYGLVALGMLRMTQVEPLLRYVRLEPKLISETIPPGDQIKNEDLQKVITWLQSRQKKFKKKFGGDPKNPLRANRKKMFRKEELVHTEQLLLLALGAVSIYLLSVAINQETSTLERDTVDDVMTYLSRANGGWHPGQVVFAQNLWHYRVGYKDNLFSSCYLPLNLFEYNSWIATAIGLLAQKLKTYSYHFKLLLGFSSIQHREWLFQKQKNNKDRNTEGRLLRITIDHIFSYAIRGQRMMIAGGLAARYLAINNILGWNKQKDKSKCFSRGRQMKLIAKISGCLVEGDAAQLDFSELSTNHETDQLEFNDNFEEYRRLFRMAQRSITNSFALSNYEDSDNTIVNDVNLQEVAKALGRNLSSSDQRAQSLYVLKSAFVCLSPRGGKSGSQEEIAKLIDVQQHTFRAFMDASLVSGVFALAEQLRLNGNLEKSVFREASHVTEVAELLLIWLERPYMADIEVRGRWQRQLREIYTDLDKGQRDLLSLDDKLLIFAAVSHVTAAAMKSLDETQADQLEKTIYEEELEEYNSSFKGAKARSNLRVNADELSKILEQQEERGRCRTAFIQIILSSDATLATILVARRLNSTIVSFEEDLPFEPETHQGILYKSWEDISAEVVEHDYFNNQTQRLHKYSESPLGQRSVGNLWQRILVILQNMDAVGLPDHIWLVPDGGLANIPWQLVAMEEALSPNNYQIITLAHGLRWIYLSAHSPENTIKYQKFHARGIQAWISSIPTPRADLDIRKNIKNAFLGADNDSPAMSDQNGVSLSVVFGHGEVLEGSPIAETEAVKTPQDWHDVRESRICVLLSCYTGTGRPGALGDYVSISHKLSRTSKALLAPPVEVPHTAVLTLANVFHKAFDSIQKGRSWRIQEIYREALRLDPAVALFSFWGLGYEPLIWKAQGKNFVTV